MIIQLNLNEFFSFIEMSFYFMLRYECYWRQAGIQIMGFCVQMEIVFRLEL